MPARPSGDLALDTSVQFVRGVGPRRAAALETLGIRTVEDLLHHFPIRHEDYGALTPIALIQPGGLCTVRGKVIDLAYRAGATPRFDAAITDGTGTARLTWFHGKFLIGKIKQGDDLLISGKAENFGGQIQFVNPKHQVNVVEPSAGDASPMVPVYPAGAGLDSRKLAAMIKPIVEQTARLVPEPFDAEHLRRLEMPPLPQALRWIHLPRTNDDVKAARRRLIYDELFLLELGVAIKRRREVSGSARPLVVNELVDSRIRARFPFALTAAQDRALKGIVEDLRRNRPMNRMLQGDVGCGKTVVALYAALSAIACGFQAAVMAPTEILAEQHHRNASKYLDGSRVRMRMLAGGLSPAVRRERLRAVAAGEVDLIIGTQALIEDDVRFSDLALVVVDEQHKFGVLQRARFRSKGLDPHYLVMTATPIPRTLSLTYFGDLDVSTIDELPPGREPVKTQIVFPKGEGKALDVVRARLAVGEQAYVVCPLVEQSETVDLKSATEEAERLAAEFPDHKVACLHGRMSSADKDAVMAAFGAGRIHVLVSTVVIEVGVDVPNATVMLVRHAERFGLSQLHQLRGRIGRGGKAGHCLLFAEGGGEGSRARLEVLTRTNDGFRIAEEDLRIRGPGEFFGTRQHGLPELKIADLLRDVELLEIARREAFELVARDPTLSDPRHTEILRRLRAKFADTLELIRVA